MKTKQPHRRTQRHTQHPCKRGYHLAKLLAALWRKRDTTRPITLRRAAA